MKLEFITNSDATVALAVAHMCASQDEKKRTDCILSMAECLKTSTSVLECIQKHSTKK